MLIPFTLSTRSNYFGVSNEKLYFHVAGCETISTYETSCTELGKGRMLGFPIKKR